MFKKSLVRLLVAPLVLMALVGSTGTAAADDEGGPGVDTKNLAESRRVPVSIVQAETVWQEALLDVLDSIRRDQSSIYVSSKMRAEAKTGEVVFNAPPPKSVLADLAQVGGVSVRVSPGLISEVAMADQVAKTYAAITATPGVAEATAYPDESLTSIVAHVQLKKGATSSEVTKAAAAASQRRGGLATKITVVDDAGNIETNLYGGAAFTTSGGAPLCTAGFSVRHSSGEGLSTAKHCVNGSTGYYRNTNSTTTIYPLTHAGSSTYDTAWYHRGTHTAVAAFYRDYSTSQSVYSSGGTVVGQSIANFGRTTGYHGSLTVYKQNICANGYCGLTAVRTYVTAGGDSGGPYFWNSKAHGIHHGVATIDGASRSLFTDVTKLPSGVSVKIL